MRLDGAPEIVDVLAEAQPRLGRTEEIERGLDWSSLVSASTWRWAAMTLVGAKGTSLVLVA
ncbi:hypothetical protein [Luteimicrobium sp. DT211]|uniref:hypothetical protein n=1 Tax=Luteimicrobium sp. DT211 TaxID=3393412 RepID=UPI003CFA717C